MCLVALSGREGELFLATLKIVEEGFDIGRRPLPRVLVGELGDSPNQFVTSRDRVGLQETHSLLASPTLEHAVEHGRRRVQERDVLCEHKMGRSRHVYWSVHMLHLTQPCGVEFSRG